MCLSRFEDSGIYTAGSCVLQYQTGNLGQSHYEGWSGLTERCSHIGILSKVTYLV